MAIFVLATLASRVFADLDVLERSVREGLGIFDNHGPALTSKVVQRYVKRSDRHYMVTFGDDVTDIETIQGVVKQLHDVYNGGDSEKQEYLYIGSVTHHKVR